MTEGFFLPCALFWALWLSQGVALSPLSPCRNAALSSSGHWMRPCCSHLFSNKNDNNHISPETLTPPSKALEDRINKRQARTASNLKEMLQNATGRVDASRDAMRNKIRSEIQQIRREVLLFYKNHPTREDEEAAVLRADQIYGRNETEKTIHSTIVQARDALKNELHVVLQKQHKACQELEENCNKLTLEISKFMLQLLESTKMQEQAVGLGLSEEAKVEYWKDVNKTVSQQEQRLMDTLGVLKGGGDGGGQTEVSPMEQQIIRALSEFESHLDDQLQDLRDDVNFLLGIADIGGDAQQT